MAITRATNLAAVGSGLGANPAQPIDIGSGIQMDGSSTGIITATTFSGTATNAGTAVNIGVGATGYSLVLSGDLTAANVTVGGTLTYDDVTNVDSIGLITARNGLDVTGVSTFKDNVRLLDDDKIVLGTGEDLEIYHDGTNSRIYNGTGNLVFRSSTYNFNNAAGTENCLDITQNGSVDLYYDNSKKLETTAGGIEVTGHSELDNVNVSGVSTFSGKINANSGVGFTGFLREGINIVSGKLSDNTTINIDHSMAHYFTTTETTTGIPNFTSTAGINTDLSVGETFSVNVITTAATAGYSTGARIDAGSTLPVLWNGGDDPSEGGSGGVDVYTYQVIKTGDAAFTVLGNVSNFA